MSAAVYRPSRCEHAMLAGACPVAGCPHFDGGVDEKGRIRSKRLRRTLVCHRCGRRVPRERLGADRCCRGGCKEAHRWA